ncbi:MAG: phosphate ABC transporter permease PstA [Planctomycetaceae bacterium]|nr:phosphate ABC transporter permease PstA [Planctomycetaceae bacterium]
MAQSQRSDGKVWIFLCRACLILILAMMGLLAALIIANSFHALWPNRIEQVRMSTGESFLGFPVNADVSPEGLPRLQYKVGNRELNSGADFRWVYERDIESRDYPGVAMLVSRTENGDFLGTLGGPEDNDTGSPAHLLDRLDAYRARWNAEAEPLLRQMATLGEEWQRIHLAALKAGYEAKQASAAATAAEWESKLHFAQERESAIKALSERLMTEFAQVKDGFARESVVLVAEDATRIVLPLSAIVDVSWPNAMNPLEKLGRFAVNIWHLLTRYPREANTEGGIYPALFGTIMLVFLMAISAFPLGVAAGIYLREYAKDGFLPRIARVAVNNLAGVPSIVYGIFGLGFFIYGMGGTIDSLLYPERVAAGINTYGGGGIIWSALTLGLLTLPVVIVATEEALATVPSEIRQGSLALGATRFQTLVRVILPMASPGILTGFILAMARAAGEVAPLMLTGAVKSAHSLPLDGSWPFVHLERKFMHLGFHIYDMGFQSPNVEASKPLVYVTALVLLVLVFVLNFAAISLRKRMREKYAMKGF